MFEVFAFPLLLGAAVWSGKKSKMKDKKKIEIIFKNLKIGVGGEHGPEFPKFVRKEKIIDKATGRELGTDYVYRLPLGISSKAIQKLNENSGVFNDGLHKVAELEFDGGMLHVNVYEQKLPKKWDFSEVPLREGTWEIPLGMYHKGIEWYDFEKFPHMLNGGSTRYGKTVLLKVIMTSLILQNPDDVEFYIIDLKGGLEFEPYKNLKQVKGIAADAEEAHTLLCELAQKAGEQKQVFLENGWNNIVNTPIKKRTFVIVDEAAELTPDKWMKPKKKDMLGECQAILSGLARVAGGLGFRLLYCTQYPTSDTTPRSVKQNCNLRISFTLPDGYASAVILGEGNYQASELPELPGRAVMKTSSLKEIQVPFLSDDKMQKLLACYKEVKDHEQSPIEEGTDGEDLVKFG